MGIRVIWISCDRRVDQRQALLIGFGARDIPSSLARLQHQVLRGAVARTSERGAELLRNTSGDVALDLNHVARGTVVGLGPSLNAVLAAYQLGVDADCVRRAPNAAGQDVRHIQLRS